VTSLARRLSLVGALLLAGGLRFAGLGWGLRHTPIRDEQDFVENVGRMLRAGDWDHRFYEYPGLFFYILRPVLAFAPRTPSYYSDWTGFDRRTYFGPKAYLLARGVVASFGVTSVLLVHQLGSRLLGPEAAVIAALLLAVSPVEVSVAHEVRPDVVLESFALLALLSYARLGNRTRDDALAGFATGAAAAVKFTGVLLLPAYLVARLLTPGPRARGMLAAAAATAGLWLLTTPYAALHWKAFVEGAAFQVHWHYGRHPPFASAASALPFCFRTLAWSLGPVGVALAVVGLVSLRNRARAWAPPLMYAVLVVTVLSSASRYWHRLELSTLGIAALVAASGFEAIRRRATRFGWLVALVACVIPFLTSLSYVRSVRRPGTRDLALDWIEAHLQDGARILSTVHELGIDRSRFEMVEETGNGSLDHAVARHADLVVWHVPDRTAVHGLHPFWHAKPLLRGGGFGEMPELSLRSLAVPIVLFGSPRAPCMGHAAVSLEGATLTASSNAQRAALAADGRIDTSWSTMAPQRPEDFFQVLLPRRVRLESVELVLGDRWLRYGRAIRLSITDDGSRWVPVRYADARAAVEEQPDRDRGGASQLLAFEPVSTRGIRITPGAYAHRSWGFAEVRLRSAQECDDPAEPRFHVSTEGAR
jgi:hypothetical protein